MITIRKIDLLSPMDVMNHLVVEEMKQFLIEEIRTKGKIRVINQFEGSPISEVFYFESVEQIVKWYTERGC